MKLTQLYPKAHAASQRLRKAGRPDDAQRNYHALNSAVRDWRCGKLNDEELKDVLDRIIAGDVITPPEEGIDPASA